MLGPVTGHGRKIRGGEVERGELLGEHPAKRGVFKRARCRARRSEAANEGKHFDDDGRVSVQKGRERTDDLRVASEFLVEFAEECVGGRLTGLDLAAGKFPLEGEVFVGRALGDEEAAGGVLDESAGDGEGFGLNHVRTKTRRARKLHVFSRWTVDSEFSATVR